MSSLLARLFYLSCELRPDLPENKLLNLLGKAWPDMIRSGAQYGLAGSSQALPTISFDQLSNFYMMGAESGATPDLEEFRSALSGAIYERICGNENLSVLDQINMASKLGLWLNGRASQNGDSEIDWDQEVTTPMYTKVGFWPIDQIHSDKGVPQGICTVLSQPGVGKSTIGTGMGLEWRRKNIGSVIMLQTELSPAGMRKKIDGMIHPHDKLFRSGIDRIIFGRRQVAQALDTMIDNPDPNRLVLFDSVTGYCGQGDGPDSRTRFAELYDALCQVKNASRLVFAFSHVRRGEDMAHIEMSAGSSAIERFSDSLIYLSSDQVPLPDGRVEIKIESIKNRWDQQQRPFKFLFNYETGQASEIDEMEDLE